MDLHTFHNPAASRQTKTCFQFCPNTPAGGSHTIRPYRPPEQPCSRYQSMLTLLNKFESNDPHPTKSARSQWPPPFLASILPKYWPNGAQEQPKYWPDLSTAKTDSWLAPWRSTPHQPSFRHHIRNQHHAHLTLWARCAFFQRALIQGSQT